MQEKFQGELLPGESLLWSGQPGSGLFTRTDVFLVPFSLMWGGFALFWEGSVLGLTVPFNRVSQRPPLLFALFGIPFVCVGLYAVAGCFFYKQWRNRRTFYAVTNQRVLVLTETGARTCRASFIKQLPIIDRRVNADGSGTLRFGYASGLPGLAMYENIGMDFFAGSSGGAHHELRSVGCAVCEQGDVVVLADLELAAQCFSDGHPDPDDRLPIVTNGHRHD